MTTANEQPVAIFMMGGPAAGKSTVRAKMFAGVVAIDSDSIKAEHPEYDESKPWALHEWSSQEASRRFYAALGTGKSVGIVKRFVDEAVIVEN
jgi:predicted kinase